MLWATHWLLGFIRHCLFDCHEAAASDGSAGHDELPPEYCSKSFYRFLWLSDNCWPIESIMKATLPFLTMSQELYLAHDKYL